VSAPLTLRFRAGTLEILGLPEDDARVAALARWDAREARHRAPAIAYPDLVRLFTRASIPFVDEARRYVELPSGPVLHREPRLYQAEAIEAWRRARGRGVVVLPTGAGKTHVAVMAIADKRRATLVIAPTLDLVRQWYDVLRASFDQPVGLVGGGEHDVRDLTVTTYDSAHLHMEYLGDRFGLLVFDEAHHLPSSGYAFAAKAAIAPFRLGLTATPERADGKDADLEALVGPIVYRKDVQELRGEFLADYDVQRVVVDLEPDERDDYEEARAVYRGFLSKNGISLRTPAGFGEFILKSTFSEEGRAAMAAYRRQRALAFAARGKLAILERLLHVHRHDPAIVFTQDNATAHLVSRRFLLPAITHQTKVRERSEILAGLADGTYGAVVTSKVLNEGVDVPDASVAVVLSGSGSVREHVQRLGRVLRKKGDKRAVLYELVSGDTSETYTSERRREHVAYR
jgi:superfamily II DNA or RNA helicase